MDALSCRLLPYEVADGPHNMAADEVLLQTAATGLASLRFYGWRPATLSLGYFQSWHDVQDDSSLRGLPVVRRASGGLTLVHHHELTYCLALPANSLAPVAGERVGVRGPALPPHPQPLSPATGARGGKTAWLAMHMVLADALAELGVTAHPYVGVDEHGAGPLCFHHFTAGDLMIGAAKVAGSAQRKQRGAVMQHGGVLLAQSPHTPSLPGLRELTGVVVEAAVLAQMVVARLSQRGWTIEVGTWTAAERARIETLAQHRYAADSWTRKR